MDFLCVLFIWVVPHALIYLKLHVSAGRAWSLWEDGNSYWQCNELTSEIRYAEGCLYSITLTVPGQMPIFRERSYILSLIKYSSALLPEYILLLVWIQNQKTVQNVLQLYNHTCYSLRRFLNGGQKIMQ